MTTTRRSRPIYLEEVFVIQSVKPSRIDSQGKAVWYRPHRAGYTTSLKEAGYYSEFEARELLEEDDSLGSPYADGFLQAYRLVDVLHVAHVPASQLVRVKVVTR